MRATTDPAAALDEPYVTRSDAGADAAKGIDAFLGKRSPVWRG